MHERFCRARCNLSLHKCLGSVAERDLLCSTFFVELYAFRPRGTATMVGKVVVNVVVEVTSHAKACAAGTVLCVKTSRTCGPCSVLSFTVEMMLAHLYAWHQRCGVVSTQAPPRLKAASLQCFYFIFYPRTNVGCLKFNCQRRRRWVGSISIVRVRCDAAQCRRSVL